MFDVGRVHGGGVEMGSTSAVHMRAAKSFRKEKGAHKDDLVDALPLSALDPRSVPVPFSMVGVAGVTVAMKG